MLRPMSSAPPAVTLAIGSEQLLVDRAISELSIAARRADPSLQRFDIAAGDDDATQALLDATAPTLFGDGAIVIVTDVDQTDSTLVDALTAIAAAPPDNVHLLLTHPGGVKGKALLDAMRRAGAVEIDCAVVKGRRSALDFIAREFADRKRKATGDAVAALYDSIGHDIGLLAGAVSQLVSDVEANPIGIDDVRDYFAAVSDVSGFVISDAVWERRFADALRALRMSMLVEQGRVGPMTVSSLASGLRTMVRVGGMAPGANENDVAREAGVPAWKVRTLRRQWSRWSADQRRLAAAVVALADADASVKGGVREGTSLDPEQKLLALEMFVARTTASSRP